MFVGCRIERTPDRRSASATDDARRPKTANAGAVFYDPGVQFQTISLTLIALAVRAIGSTFEFPDNAVMTIIDRRDGSKPMYPARMALLVAGHAAFMATFVWLFH
jgi:hypothetical protein